MNQPHVLEALGAETDGYDSCNFDVNRNFLLAGDWMQPFHRLVPGILEQIPVLVYAGDADFICNWLGNHAWTEALEWPGQKAFNKVPLEDLVSTNDYPSPEGGMKLVEGTKIGEVKSSGNFTFMRLHAGGIWCRWISQRRVWSFLIGGLGGSGRGRIKQSVVVMVNRTGLYWIVLDW